jgi:hypothetical protein
LPSPFRDSIRLSKDEAFDLVVTLEAARANLQEQTTWTSLLIAVHEQEVLVSGRLLR